MYFSTDESTEFFTDERCFITEIINDPSLDLASLAQARVTPGVTTELHSLAVTEIYYVLEGQGEMEIAGQPKKKLSKGDAALIKAGTSQRITNTGIIDLKFLCICLPRFQPEGYAALE